MTRVEFEPCRKRLADGTEVSFRLIEPTDGPGLVELFHVLSPETIYNRFLTPVHDVKPEHVRRLVEIDQWNEVALAACLDHGGREIIVGVGRFHRDPDDPGTAEVGVLVGDPWQSRGIGGMLLKELVGIARCADIKRFCATVLPDNLKLRRFAEYYGFKGKSHYEDGVLRMSMDL